MQEKLKEKLNSKAKQIQMICDHILKECEHDKHLAERVSLENKTVDKMYQCIVNAVRKNFKDQIVDNGVCVDPEDVYSLAIHYFIEDDETLEKELSIKLDKKENKSNTEQVKKEEPAKVEKETKARPSKVEEGQLSLFDFGVDG